MPSSEWAYMLILTFLYVPLEASLSDVRDGNFLHGSDDITVERIGSTRDYRVSRKNQDNKSWYDGRELPVVQCVREGKCEPLKHKTCLGSKIPYTETSVQLTYSKNQDQIQERLQSYNVLKNIPKCWAAIQPFLCAVFMPKCEVVKNYTVVHLPSIEMCRNVKEHCKVVYNTTFFPDFLKCNSTFFHSKCDNDVREMKFNLSSQCLPPLVQTPISFHFYDGFTGCGLPCRDPLYTEDEHSQIRRLILWGGSISLVLTLFTIFTFLIDWHSSSKYPALVIFYISVCYLISSMGWLSQFIFDSRGDIVCSKDGTRRRGEPSAGENLSCVIIFVLVYYFLIAACVWFVIFTYVWHISFRAFGKIQERIDKKAAYFHLVAWSLPLVLTIMTMALGEIDGSSITGICFVGYLNLPMRTGFLLGPLSAVVLVGGYFLCRGIITLIFVRSASKDIISVRASSKIHSTIMRGAVTAILVLIFIAVTFVYHIYEFVNTDSWYKSFRLFLVCKLTSMHRGLDPLECRQETRPSVAMLQLQLLCLFFSVCLMTSWVCTESTIQTWKRYIRMKCGIEKEEPAKLQKHKLIAQAFARRKDFYKKGRMSISFHNTHTDPVGLNFELNSMASHDFSSTWANNLPRFVERRGALTGVQNSHSQCSSAPRRNSQDSQISFSLRHVSVESRRNSLDSQVSVKIAEMKTKVASRRRVKSQKSSRRRPPKNSAIYTRKESTTSVESQIGTHIVHAMASSTRESRHENVPRISNRRVATTGLNQDQINLLLSNGKFILPFLQNHALTTSEEEDASTTSFKIRDSQLNIVLHQKDNHLSMEDINRVSNGLPAIKYGSDSDSENKSVAHVHRGRKKSDYSSDDDEDDDDLKRQSEKDRHKEVYESKSSSKSKSSHRSSRQNGRVKNKRISKTFPKSIRSSTKSKDSKVKVKNSDVCGSESAHVKSSLGSSVDSYCLELARLGIQSSYSGISMGKNNSRNSKTSCDVGIQANSHEIANQTLSSIESELNLRNKINPIQIRNADSIHISGLDEKNSKSSDMVVAYRRDDKEKSSPQNVKKKYAKDRRDEESNEPLLKKKSTSSKPVIVKKKLDVSVMSESNKIKQLLLPSTK